MSESSSPLSEQQRKVLADKVFTAAVANAEKAAGDDASASYGHANAAAELTHAFIALTRDFASDEKRAS